MASSINSTQNNQLNRFTLSFRDPAIESAFLDEYGKNALRVSLTYLPWIALLLIIGLGLVMTFMPHLMFLRNFCFGGLGFLVLLFLYFRLLPPGVHFIQFTFSAIGASLGLLYTYGLIFLQGSNLQAYVLVLILIHTVSMSLGLPLRFIYSVFTVYIIWFGFGFVAFFLSNLDAIDALSQLFFLASLNCVCVFATYQREAATRVNFLQKRVIEKREAQVTELAEFLKKMFGRYLSTEVMSSIIENPSALELGGERRKVTIMMTDLRGFTALSERLEPERVVQMLNAYFEVMVDTVIQYNGTINEIIGDALLVVFGAPQKMQDRAQRAVACAIAMQNAMTKVNEENRAQGLPELEMGIGLNEAEVIVGNIGSSKRSNYTVIGSGVNMASRIESYTIGGQVLISESVKRKIGEILRIDNKKDVMPKGAETAITIYEVGGIGGQYNLALEGKDPVKVTLMRQIPVQFSILGGKHVSKKGFRGRVVRLSRKGAEIEWEESFEILTNLKMNLESVTEELAAKDFYGKIIEPEGEGAQTQMVRFTSVPPEVDSYFQAHLQYTAKQPHRETN